MMQCTIMTLLSAVCQAGSLPISLSACGCKSDTTFSQDHRSPLSDDVYSRLAKGSWAAAEAVITTSKSLRYFTQSLCWQEQLYVSPLYRFSLKAHTVVVLLLSLTRKDLQYLQKKSCVFLDVLPNFSSGCVVGSHWLVSDIAQWGSLNWK